jgi:hypothetical protein
MASVAAVVTVVAPTKEYVGAWIRKARWVVIAPVANCTVRARLTLTSMASVDAASVVWAPPVNAAMLGEPDERAAGHLHPGLADGDRAAAVDGEDDPFDVSLARMSATRRSESASRGMAAEMAGGVRAWYGLGDRDR